MQSSPILTRATSGSAGYELNTPTEIILQPGERIVVNTGVTIQLPQDMMAIIRPKSGHALRYGIQVLAGLIDSDFKDEIRVILYNSGKETWSIESGKSVAQMTLERYHKFSEEIVKLDNSAHTGFGSTNC